MKTLLKIAVGLCLVLIVQVPAIAQQVANEKVTKIILKIETEDKGIRLPEEKSLTATEISRLRLSIIKGLSSLPNVKIVTPEEKGDVLGILVVAQKLNAGRNEYIILSSVMTISLASGPDLFVSHNVFVDPNLDVAAEAVVYQLVSARLAMSLGIH